MGVHDGIVAVRLTPLASTRNQPAWTACAGSKSRLKVGSRQLELDGLETGECGVCRGRFRLGPSDLIPPHQIAAPLDVDAVHLD
jgi:hypothetical protein